MLKRFQAYTALRALCVALVCAAAGVTVAKHGNRAVTSSVGSADVMEALGIPFDLGPEDAARALRDQGFAFFFSLGQQAALGLL